jgi:hypothetical protein
MFALVDHPHVRNNPATLTVLTRHWPQLMPRLLASVRAPDRIKQMLARYMAPPYFSSDTALGWTLLRDPEAGSNPDVLSVLVNTQLSDWPPFGVIYAASRRLPEDAFRSWEYPYVPLH